MIPPFQYGISDKCECVGYSKLEDVQYRTPLGNLYPSAEALRDSSVKVQPKKFNNFSIPKWIFLVSSNMGQEKQKRLLYVIVKHHCSAMNNK